MLRVSVSIVFLAALPAALPALRQQTTLQQVLDNYYGAIGGAEAWEAVESIRLTGRMTMRHGEGPFTQVVKRPGRLRLEFTIQGVTVVKAYDGVTAWMILPFRGTPEPQIMPAEVATAFVKDADIDGPLVGYEEEGHQIELLGLDETEGTEAYKLKVTLKSGAVEYYYLDSEYYLPIKVERSRMMHGAAVDVAMILGDYKEVGGLMMAHFIEYRAAGSPSGQTLSIERVEVDVEIDDDLFAMPSSNAD